MLLTSHLNKPGVLKFGLGLESPQDLLQECSDLTSDPIKSESLGWTQA